MRALAVVRRTGFVAAGCEVDINGDGILNVRGTKTARSRRTVPVPLRASQVLSALPPRLDTPLLFPSPHGGSYNACNWRRREFNWARDAAGLASKFTPYTLRHSGIS